MPFFLIWWMIAVLPFVIFLEGYKRFIKPHIREKHPFWRFLYLLVFILILILLILWGIGIE